MSRVIVLLILVGVSSRFFAQSSTVSPLGVLVHPAKNVAVSDKVRKVIPPNAVVRWMQQTHLSGDGETALIYDTGDEFEPKAHIAFVKNRKRIGDYRLVEAFRSRTGIADDDADNFELYQATEISLEAGREGLMTAFRNIGDGSATVFALVIEKDGKYSLAWSNWTSQAQFRVRPNGTFQIWNSDEVDDCVWCKHHYQVTNYVWKNESLVRLSHYTTKHSFSPYQFSENPIVVKP